MADVGRRGRRRPRGGSTPRATTLVALSVTLAFTLASGCRDRDDPSAAGVPGAERAAPQPARLGLGTAATETQVAALDIDVNAAGTGLPAGRGTHAEGAVVFARSCARCHGAKGEGVSPFPKLVGTPDSSFRFAQDVKLPKTPANYWPYATTLYDYIHRAMPFDAPGSLPPNEVYSVVAFILAENRLIARDAVIDARTLPRVHMPARSHFVRDDRTGGGAFR